MKGDILHFYRLHYGYQAERWSFETPNDVHQTPIDSKDNAIGAYQACAQLRRSFQRIRTLNKIANHLQMLTIRQMKFPIRLTRKVSS